MKLNHQLLLNRDFGAAVKMLNNNHQIISKYLLGIVFTCLSVVSLVSNGSETAQLEDGTDLSLFGIGVHQEKLNDIYIGALYTPSQITSVSEISDEYVAKRMSLKFVSKYSNRKMSRMWKQRIAMNNQKGSWKPMTKEIIQFASLFKRAMQEGDEINIDFVPNAGTKVYINQTLFLTINNSGFFNLLLNIWIGNVPPTEAFKKGISGQTAESINTQLITQFDTIQPIIGRFDDDLQASPALVAKSEAPQKKNADSNNAAQKNKTTTKKPPNKTTAAPSNSKTKAQIENDKKVATISKPNVEPVKTKVESTIPTGDKAELFKTDFTVKDATNINIGKEVKKKAESPKNESNTASKKKKPTEKVAKVVEPEEFFDEDLLAGSYTQELINSIRKYQSYPKKALAAGHEGSVTALVTIDRNGELVNYAITQRTSSRILNREVLRMIKKAAPFPKIPDQLTANEFEFEVPMNFTLEQ